MVEANVKIIEELKAFIAYASSDTDTRKLFTNRESDFIRDRKLTFARVVQLIINLPKRSLSIEVSEFFKNLADGGQHCTKGAFSLQRSKLKPLFFFMLNQVLSDCFYHYYGNEVKRWRGFRLFATDGSTMYLPDTPGIVDHFGKHSNQHSQVPLARVMEVEDVLNKIVVYGLAADYPEDGLLLFDRGFCCYALVWLLLNQERERKFVIRCRTKTKYIAAFLKTGKKTQIITIYPDASAIKQLRKQGYILTPQNGVLIRLVRIKLPNGETEVLMTNLYDNKLYSNKDLAQLYALRWSIEGTYSQQKNELQLEIFSGHRVITVLQDYYANVFIGNLQNVIEKQCISYITMISQRRKYSYKINRNTSWSCLKDNVVRLFISNDPINILMALQKAFEKNVEPRRPGRTIPRTKKSRRLTGKYQTFTNYRRAI